MENTKDYVLYTPEHLRVKEILIEIARRKSVITYSELIAKARLKLDMEIPYDRGQLGLLLGEISWNESLYGRLMLSSVAVTKHSFRHGQGFLT